MTRLRIQTSVFIGGSPYRTARGAAHAWARQVAQDMERRHGDKTGQAAYHDPAWEARNGKDPAHDVVAGPLVFNNQPTKLESKAYRRCLPVFKRLLKS